MKSRARLDSRKVIREIRTLKSKLDLVLQTGEEYEELHTDIIRLLKAIGRTKSEYKEFADYPQAIAMVFMEDNPDGEPVEVGRTAIFSDKDLAERRSALGIRLQELLGDMEAEYKLRTKLEARYTTDIKDELKNMREEIAQLKAEVSRLGRKSILS
jgi:archaellum component FlaC